MKVSIPVIRDSYNSTIDNIVVVFDDESPDGNIHIAMDDRDVTVDREDLIKVLKIIL